MRDLEDDEDAKQTKGFLCRMMKSPKSWFLLTQNAMSLQRINEFIRK
ncbi:hypothetical protein PO124_19245 [Bacillus licheniformis]|nr:hypothetical protein [Bacillus licheniformis]